MAELTVEGQQRLEEIAARHGVGAATAEALLSALVAGGGTQAQFNLPEIGGMGQWSQGGMVMVGDMFNNSLKARVDALCSDLAGLLAASGTFAPRAQAQASTSSLFVPGSAGGGSWWPADLGAPASVGSQNDMRYAFFPAARRLAIEVRGKVRVYDTGEHQLSGFSQQQSGDQSLSFTSQHGLVQVSGLNDVTAGPVAAVSAPPTQERPIVAASAPESAGGTDEIFTKIERLADLHARGIVTAQEFEAKKAELLGRL